MAHSTDLHWFAHLRSQPTHGKNFNDHMHGYLLGRPQWFDEAFYPIKDRVFEGFDATDKNAVMLIDLAGGIGHYTEELLAKHPDAPGRFILQDLPVVIDSVQSNSPRLEKMAYDFFTEQPVKGEWRAQSRLECWAHMVIT